MSMRFQAYGIRVDYPEQYRIYFSQNQKFQFEEGVVKFDDPAGADNGRASLTISWEPAAHTEQFAEKYLEAAETHYQKKMKNRYNILEKKLQECDGHETAYLHVRIASSTHVLKPLGKSILLELIQTARYCPETNRIVIATAMAEKAYLQTHQAEFEAMLSSISCHADIFPGKP